MPYNKWILSKVLTQNYLPFHCIVSFVIISCFLNLKLLSHKIRSISKVCMTTETARDSSLGTLMEKDPMLRQMPNVALALHLLLEKSSPCSFWEPYINILPRYRYRNKNCTL